MKNKIYKKLTQFTVRTALFIVKMAYIVKK